MSPPDEAVRGVEVGQHTTQVAFVVKENQARSSQSLTERRSTRFLPG
jgi:hypothetical protein